MKRNWLAALLAGVVSITAPTWAESQGRQHEPAPNAPVSPREHLEEAARQILRILEQMMLALPQYEAPEVLDNGDIIIRRKRPETPRTTPREGDDRSKT